MKVLVTGSAGKLGSVTIKHLKALNYSVYGIDIIKSDTTDELADITNPAAMLTLCRNFDAIITYRRPAWAPL